MDSAEIKRQILQQSDITGIRKKIIQSYEGGKGYDEILEMAAAFEQLVQTKGWAYIEAYIIAHANPIAQLFAEGENLLQKGQAQGLIKLMQYVDQVISAAKDIIRFQEEAKGQAEKEGGARRGRKSVVK